MRLRRDHGALAANLVFVALAGYVAWAAWPLPAGGAMMPLFAAAGVAAFALYQIGTILARGDEGVALRGRYLHFDRDTLRPMAVLGLTALYVPAMFWLGYFTATALFLAAASLLLGVRDWRAIALTAVIVLPLMYGFFVAFLSAELPDGLLV